MDASGDEIGILSEDGLGGSALWSGRESRPREGRAGGVVVPRLTMPSDVCVAERQTQIDHGFLLLVLSRNSCERLRIGGGICRAQSNSNFLLNTVPVHLHVVVAHHEDDFIATLRKFTEPHKELLMV